jgi:hypothetical protein
VELLPAVELRRIAAAAAKALSEAPPTLGERRVRDALLDHIAVTIAVDDDGDHAAESVRIPVRLVLGLIRMGFVGEGPIAVRRSSAWMGLVGEYGAAWYRQPLVLQPRRRLGQADDAS